jgi:hypothetical protein
MDDWIEMTNHCSKMLLVNDNRLMDGRQEYVHHASYRTFKPFCKLLVSQLDRRIATPGRLGSIIDLMSLQS